MLSTAIAKLAQHLMLGALLDELSNCNGGIKELLCFGEAPQQSALWLRRVCKRQLDAGWEHSTQLWRLGHSEVDVKKASPGG